MAWASRPAGAPSSSTTRTCGTRIISLMRRSLLSSFLVDAVVDIPCREQQSRPGPGCRRTIARAFAARQRTRPADEGGRAAGLHGPRTAASDARRSASASQPSVACCSSAGAPRRGTAPCAPPPRGRRARACRAPSAPAPGGSCSACGCPSRRPRRAGRARASTAASSRPASMWRSAMGIDAPPARAPPEREGAGEVLGDDADEALERAVDGAVDGHRALGLAGLVDVVSGRSARAASPGRPGWSPSATHGRGRRPRRGRSWARRRCRRWA